VQVAVDDAALVDGGDGLGDVVVDGSGPVGEGGQLVVARLGAEHRTSLRQHGVERLALDVLHHQELVLTDRQVVDEPGHGVEPAEALEGVALATEAGDGVGAVAVEPGVGPGLLEHHPLAGPPVDAGVHAAAVGEVERLVDRVGQLAEGGGVAGRQVGGEARRGRDPRWHREHGPAHVGHQLAVGVLDGQHQLAVLVVAVAGGEAAVAHVDRAVAPAQVAQDVGAGLAGEGAGEVAAQELELGVVAGVDGDELAAAAATGVLRVAGQHHPGAGEELEGHVPLEAVVPDGLDDPLGVVEAARHVDLPTLARKVVIVRRENDPVAAGDQSPEMRSFAPAEGVGLGGDRSPRIVIELGICHAKCFIVIVHDRGDLRRVHLPLVCRGQFLEVSALGCWLLACQKVALVASPVKTPWRATSRGLDMSVIAIMEWSRIFTM